MANKMTEHKYIVICFELDPILIREIRDKLCRTQCGDIVINSALTESGIYNVNAALNDPDFLCAQERVRNELKVYVKELLKTHPELGKILIANSPQIFEHNLHELHKWTYTLKKIIDKSRRQIKLLFPRSYSTNHLYLLEAEGETSATKVREALYKRTDFMAQLLKNFANSLDIDHEEYDPLLTFSKRWEYHSRRILRTFGIAIARGLMHSRNAFKHHSNAPHPSTAEKGQLPVFDLFQLVKGAEHVAGV
jgi:hypothetical protein